MACTDGEVSLGFVVVLFLLVGMGELNHGIKKGALNCMVHRVASAEATENDS